MVLYPCLSLSGRGKDFIMSDNYYESADNLAVARENSNDPISCNIIDHIGVLRVSAAGWTRELNFISWNDRPAKYDIREWTPDHKKAGRGITLTEYEMGRICEWMSQRNARAACIQGAEEAAV